MSAEVTVTIICKTDKGFINYHETFISHGEDHFEFKGKRYNIPIENTGHYPVGFWNFGRKQAMFFSQHKTFAKLFDWFKLAKNATFEVGYLYNEDNPDPLELIVKNPENYSDKTYLDNDWQWSKVNNWITKTRVIPGFYEDVDNKFGNRSRLADMRLWIILGIVAIIVVGVVVAVYFATGHGHQAVQAVTNVTATISPSNFTGGP
jgi:hypothetical protein